MLSKESYMALHKKDIVTLLSVLAVRYGNNAFPFDDAVEVKFQVLQQADNTLISDMRDLGFFERSLGMGGLAYYTISQKGWEVLDEHHNDV